jgi:hypothetical protein
LGIISFNYTKNLVSNYVNNNSDSNTKIRPEFSLINIHGELLNNNNPIIFGYGDDNSEKYQHIEDKEDNELLINFKTFQYLRSVNYKKVINLLGNQGTTVEIIGHSCGLSDKTLLKTIFEHKNVIEIEYRYHGDENNYFENLYNMSRIFSNNELMRSKVLDLSSTRKIPQIEIELSK